MSVNVFVQMLSGIEGSVTPFHGTLEWKTKAWILRMCSSMTLAMFFARESLATVLTKEWFLKG
jgi:hypothetical protein